MMYRGRIKDGKIVFDESLPWPDGQEVEIRPVEHSVESDLAYLKQFEGRLLKAVEGGEGPANDLEWLKQFEGIATDLPPDASTKVGQVGQ